MEEFDLESYITANREHFERVKGRLPKIPEMEKYIEALGRIFEGDFKYTQSGESIIVEGFITLALEGGVIPSKGALRNYLIVDMYPGIIYAAFVEALKDFFKNIDGVISTRDFNTLRETMNSLEFFALNQLPETVVVEGRDGKIILKLPLEVEIPSESVFDNLYAMSLFIAENLDRVFEKIKELIRAS